MCEYDIHANPSDPELELLGKLTPHHWHTPVQVGGFANSHHWRTLTRLARKGLVEARPRGGGSVRGSKVYRLTRNGLMAKIMLTNEAVV